MQLKLTKREAALLQFAVSERVRVMEESLKITKNGNRTQLESTMFDYAALLDKLNPLLVEGNDE
jgi:hypothetical protein